MRRRVVVATAAFFALPLSACSVLFGLDGFAGSSDRDAGDASTETFAPDRSTGEAARDGRTESETETDAANDRGPASDCMALPPLTAYWKIDEAHGVTVHDSSGNKNTGTFAGGDGAAPWVSGVFDGQAALNFNGSLEYVDFQDPPDLHLTGSMTISAWFNLAMVDEDGGPDEPILSKRALGDRGWQLYVSDDTLAFDVAQSSGSYKALYAGPNLAPSVWYHAVAVYQAGAAITSLYLNGKLIGVDYADSGIAPTQYNSGNHVHLGNAAGCTVEAGPGGDCALTQFFDGLIAEVRVYADALTACQVEEVP